MLLSDVCLTADVRRLSVCRVHRAKLENREAYRKTKIGTEVAHVTRDSDTTFKVSRSKINLFDEQKRHSLRPYSAVLCFALTVSAQTW